MRGGAYGAASMLAQEADDQLALLHEALDQEADDQEAAFQVGSLAAVAAHAPALNVLRPVDGSVATNWFSAAFGLARPSALSAPATSTIPTPSAPSEP